MYKARLKNQKNISGYLAQNLNKCHMKSIGKKTQQQQKKQIN